MTACLLWRLQSYYWAACLAYWSDWALGESMFRTKESHQRVKGNSHTIALFLSRSFLLCQSACEIRVSDKKGVVLYVLAPQSIPSWAQLGLVFNRNGCCIVGRWPWCWFSHSRTRGYVFFSSCKFGNVDIIEILIILLFTHIFLSKYFK